MSVELTDEIKAVLEENDNCPMTVQAIARRITERKRFRPDGQEVYANEVASKMTAKIHGSRFKVTAKLRE